LLCSRENSNILRQDAKVALSLLVAVGTKGMNGAGKSEYAIFSG